MSAPDTAAPPRPASTGPATPAPPAGTGFRASLRVAHLVHRGTVRTIGIVLLLAAAVTFGLYLWQRLAPDRERCRGFYRDGFAPDQLDEYRACWEATLGYQEASSWYNLLGGDPGLWFFVPVLLAAVLAAGPLVARELESGTFRLAWTQAETPRRWLTGRLALFAVVAVVTGAVLVGLFRFARTTGEQWPAPWDRAGTFHAIGPVMVAYLLLALAVGALVGLLLRRVLPAMALATLATGALLAVFHRVRMDLWPTKSAEWQFGQPWAAPRDASWTERGLLTSAGERVPQPGNLCTRDWDERHACLRENGYAGEWVEYHPASHIWPLQLVETALVLGVTAVIALLALRALRRLAP
ncbi:hypothetical protein [Streptomyces sp. NPDC049906]|uniref:hypothetical protein n=1 Tax=Streptomyces sp. NPDC049906 TaxID=3155656 RepID=UPI00343722E0